jgi:thiol-disulfide isomerase/thioredoxin
MKKFWADRPGLYPIFLLVFSGMALLFFFNAELLAQSDNGEINRLFDSMGVIKVPTTKDPVIINLPDMNGRNVSLSDFRGKIVFLNFWTTWCPTCRIEMPSMEKLHRKLKDKDFAMVTVNLQESARQVKGFFKELGLTFTALLDLTGEVGVAFGIRAIPTTYILDKTGRINRCRHDRSG